MESRAKKLVGVLRDAGWAPLAVLLVHSIASRLFGHEPYVDPIVHFLGGGAVAYFVLRAASLEHAILGRLEPLARDLLAFGLACAAAAFWELAEYASDRVLHTRVQIGLDDTMRDLALGVAGSIVLIALARSTAARAA